MADWSSFVQKVVTDASHRLIRRCARFRANEAGVTPFLGLTQSRRIEKPLEREVSSLSLRATPGDCLSREIPEESVKGDGGNENHQPQNCCESDWYALAVRPFAEQTHLLLPSDTNESAPDSVESQDASLDQPSPESCSLPQYAPILTGGMAPTGHCGNAQVRSV
jgi:hypothetical protein